MALAHSDYTITEAGFGADLGAEKFYNIKCRTQVSSLHSPFSWLPWRAEDARWCR